MSDQFIGELRLVPYNFAPYLWALALGQLLPISQNTALFSLLGTNYGGDGRSTFGLPNLQGSVALGSGQGPGLSLYDIGQTGGVQNVTLLQAQVPPHTHTAMCDGGRPSGTTPSNNAFATSEGGNVYSSAATNLQQMSANICPPVGNNMPHNNMMPYLGLNWIIAMQGVFPTRS